MLNSYIYGGFARASSRQQSFLEFREAELQNQRAVNNEGDLLDYETLELRVHPPNIQVNISESETTITLDSANRPGTLIEVVQCITELGLSFKKARITSDGGWFVDEFVVHDSNGPVKDPKKLAAIKKVLNVNFEHDEANLSAPGVHPGPCTVLELSGQDRQGLLAEIMNILSSVQCAVWSACIWTNKGRATFVLGVHDDKKPLRDLKNWHALHKQLVTKLGGADWNARARRDFVKHAALIHHERRLHRLMLSDERQRYDAEGAISRMSSTSGPCTEALCDAHKHNPDIPTDPNKPIVKVTHAPARKYWFVSILCVDRDKLLFDLVCAFVDLDFDIYHATLDAEPVAGDAVKTTIEFYVRPRLGGPEYDEAKGRLLGEMLRASILRRLPKGLKLRVRTYQNTVNKLSLGHLTNELAESGLTITRASVKPSTTCAGCAEHTFYVVDEAGDAPEASLVEASCSRAGGHLLSKESVGDFRPPDMGMHKSFSFSCIERSWRKEWGMGSGSSTSSRTVDGEQAGA